MANRTDTTIPSRFHNISDAALADLIGKADAIAKAAESELTILKDEAKRRGVELLIGDGYEVSVKDQIQGRPDVAALKLALGDGYAKFEKAVISTVVRVKSANRLAIAA